MDREEAKKLFREDKDSYGKPRGVMHKIDQIYNDFEKQIAELESKGYKVKINLIRDPGLLGMDGLSLSSESGGYRISSSKSSGNWRVIKGFLCTIRLKDLKEYEVKK